MKHDFSIYFQLVVLFGLVGCSNPNDGESPSTNLFLNLPPVVASISPASWGGGGAPVTITGFNFSSHAKVSIGGVSCSALSVVSSTQVTCVTGARGVGLVNVTVTNADGQSSTLSNAFTYLNFYYVSGESNPGKIYGYQQDPTTGALTALAGSPFATGGNLAYGIAIDPANRFLYAINYGSSTIQPYTINSQTGTITAVGSPVATLASPACAVVSANSGFLYVSSFAAGGTTIESYSIDVTTGALTAMTTYPVGGNQVNRVITDPAGKFLFADAWASGKVAVWSINGDGSLTAAPGSPFSVGSSPDGMATDISGKYLYVGNATTSGALNAFSIDQTTGALSSIATYAIGNANGGTGVDVDPGSRFVYATNFTDGTISGFSMDATTGLLTSLGSAVTAGAGANDFAFSALGNFTYVANTTGNSLSAYSVNQSTGALNLINTYTGITGAGLTTSTK